MATGSTFSEAAWAECESVIRRFEDAWRDRARPDVGEYAAEAPLDSARLLVELVHIDLEFRLRAGEFARAEDYFARFPELTEPGCALDLIAAEFALRGRHAPPAWAEEYLLRFPEHLAALRARLLVEGRTGGFSATRPAGHLGEPLFGTPVIPGYAIEGELGRGGMGVVYKARDVLLHRTVAVKTFATVPRPDGCARFAREAEAIARLDHPHIVPVYEVGEWRAPDGPAVPYFVMKWYPGGSLDATPAGPGTDARAQARTVETIARAVHHAHQRGVLHRDLKPSNILLDDAGGAHVADFGLAGRVDPADATQTAVVAGTPAYMAPEQARAPQAVSTAADVYGLGAILYHQLTGKAPFAAETPLATLDLVAHAPAVRPSSVNPTVPRDLDTICLKCLEKDPARRYASAAELADDLERLRKGLPIAARPARVWEVAYRRARRHPLVAALIATTVVALVGAVAVLADSNARVRQKERETKEAYLRECAMRYKLEDALRAEQTVRGELEETMTREQRALYLERVASAGRLYAANQLTEAWALLDACPERFRGWEWRYLDRLRRAKPTTLAGHAHPVTAVAYLADGRLVSADARGGVRVWDAAGRAAEREWACGESRVAALTVHPKQPWVAVADFNAVTVWDANTGRRLAKLTGEGWAGFSPDGLRLATADGANVHLWPVPPGVPDEGEPPEWKVESVLYGNRGRVSAAAFTPDGNLLVTAATDGTVRMWAVARAVDVATRTASSPVNGLAMAARGKMLVEAHAGHVLFTDPSTGELADRLDHPADVRPAVAVGPDGRAVAVGGANGEVVMWDTEAKQKRIYRGHPGRVAGLAFGPNRRLASCGGDVIRVWNLDAEPEGRTLAAVGDGVGGLSVSPDGTRVAVGPRNGPRGVLPLAPLLDAATGTVLHRFAGGPDVGFHAPTGRLATGKPGGGAILWNPVTSAEVWNKPLAEPRDPRLVTAPGGRRMALAAAGSLLALWDPRAGGVQLYAATDGSNRGVIDTGKVFVSAVDVSPDGGRVVVAAADAVTVWDVRTRTALSSGPAAVAVMFSPNGERIATAEGDGSVRLRDAATGREVRHFVGTGGRASALCFNSDGTRLATGGADRTLRVWDVETGRELLALTGATESIAALAWDGKNDRIFALDHAVRVWEAK